MAPTKATTARAIAPLTAIGLALAMLIGLAGPSLAVVPPDYSNVSIGLQPFMSGLSGPVQVTNAKDGSRRLFVVEQRGVIKVWSSSHGLATFLDMRTKVESSSEQGLLALAFHPDYKHNRKFYVLFTEKGTGDVIVAEYKASTANRNRASTSSFRRLLRIGHRDNTNHNGGMLAFGKKNGYLYISVGDGGGGGDTPNNAQNLQSRLGKLLRIDVNGTQKGLAYRIPANNPWAKSTTKKREIWSYGLRNPWRFSFDRLDRRHMDRRRRPGRLGGGRQGQPERERRSGRELRLARDGGRRLLSAVVRLRHDRAPAAGGRLRPRCRLRDHRRLRLPRAGDAPPGCVPVLRCVLGHDLVDRGRQAPHRRPRR